MMPFRLKNARATYQRFVNKLFEPLIAKTMEVYVDDIIVKSMIDEAHCPDLWQTSDVLRAFGMKLNPKKCIFRVRSGKFLRFMISSHGIEANSDKIEAILDIRPPRKIKEVQWLTRCIEALGRSCLDWQRSDSHFSASCDGEPTFTYDQGVDEAFQALKSYLARLPKIMSPLMGENLSLYLAVSEQAISVVLMADRTKKQTPVYYVSHTLEGVETNYPLIEKLAYALAMAMDKFIWDQKANEAFQALKA